MNIEEVKTLLEESGVEEDKIQDFLYNLEQIEDNQVSVPSSGSGMVVGSLQDQLLRENDWRKAAALAARIISYNLEN